MSKPEENTEEMLPEYEFGSGARGAYARRYAEGSNIAVVAPDLAAEFPTSEAVNAALRTVAEQRGKRSHP